MMKEETLSQTLAAAVRQVTPRRLRQMEFEKNPPPRRNDGQYPCFEFGQWVMDPKSLIAKGYVWEQAQDRQKDNA